MSVLFILSTEFEEDAKELSGVQLEALKSLLATNPFIGEHDDGIFRLDWGGSVQVYYMVGVKNGVLTISLAALSTEKDEVGKATESDLKKKNELLDTAKKAGIGMGIKELWDWIKENYPDWFT